MWLRVVFSCLVNINFVVSCVLICHRTVLLVRRSVPMNVCCRSSWRIRVAAMTMTCRLQERQLSWQMSCVRFSKLENNVRISTNAMLLLSRLVCVLTYKHIRDDWSGIFAVQVYQLDALPITALHLATSEMVWSKDEYWKNCLCVALLCAIIMVHKGTSSSYRSVDYIGLWSCLV